MIMDSGVGLPAEVLSSILRFLPQREVVHNASLVNWAWRTASGSPTLWHTLTFDVWNNRHLTSTRQFLKLLKRPQFSQLEYFWPPDVIMRMSTPSTWRKVSVACPRIQGVYVGEMSDPRGLLELAATFPRLRSLRILMSQNASDEKLVQSIQAFSGRLSELFVFRDRPNGMSSETLTALGQACPNLETFCHGELGRGPVRYSIEDIVDFINCSPKLRTLALVLGQTSIPWSEAMNKWIGENSHLNPSLEIFLKILTQETIVANTEG